MNKYIIIPVKEIEANIKQQEESLHSLQERCGIASIQWVQQNASLVELQCLLANRKQISFDEKDIEEKADKSPEAYCAYDSNEASAWEGGWSSGYKRALLDIKKELL